MAIDNDTQAPELTLKTRPAWAAAIATLVLAVGAMIGLATLLTMHEGLSAGQQVLAVIWFVLMGGVGVAGAYLLAGRRTAAFMLMVFWMVVAAAGVLAGFAWLLDSSAPLGLSTGGGVLAVLAAIFPPAVIVGLLVAAVPYGTRSRYGSMVGVSVAIAIVVVVVVNMISLAHPVQQDMQQLGRFGLSERARDIVRQVEQPMTISAIYTTATSAATTDEARDTKAQAANRLDRVNELLQEIHRVNPRIEVADASGDAARGALMGRLRSWQQARTGQHQTVLEQLMGLTAEVKQTIDDEQSRWQNIPADAYIAQWGFDAAIADWLAEAAGELEKTNREIRDQIDASPLPDYVSLLNDLAGVLEKLRSNGQLISSGLTRMAAVPSAIDANAPAALKAVDAAAEAGRNAQKLVGTPRDPQPTGEPTKVLKDLADAIGRAAIQTRKAAEALQTIAGDDAGMQELLRSSRTWRISYSETYADRFMTVAERLESLRRRLAIMLQDANAAALQREMLEIRPLLDNELKLMESSQRMVKAAIEKLQNVDDLSKQLFQAAAQGKALGEFSTIMQDRITQLLEQAESLDAPTGGKLPPELTQENILVIEAGDVVKVLTFDEVWPPLVQAGPAEGEANVRRFFNGDAAVASAILDLTHEEPFARVLLCHATTPPPAGVDPRRFRPPTGPIPLQALTELRKRLEQANFEVETWDLAQPMPADETTDDETMGPAGPQTQPAEAESMPTTPTILIVLPPPSAMPMPRGGVLGGLPDAQADRVKQAIDNGAGAIFLAMQMPPEYGPMGMPIPPQYGWNRYLSEDWGLTAEVDKWVIETVPGDTPGQFRLGPTFYFLRNSGFASSDIANRIGKPLRGRHLIWPSACPITQTDEVPPAVQVEPLLQIPETDQHIWAISDVQELVERFRRGRTEIQPQPDKGDVLPPLTLAAAATRNGQSADESDSGEAVTPARVIVLGIGVGMTDGVVSDPIPYMDRGLRTMEPARANPELIVNSCYWLIGREQYILAGPMNVGPVEPMSQTTQTVLWIVCVIGLPAIVLAAGGVVLMLRRRS